MRVIVITCIIIALIISLGLLSINMLVNNTKTLGSLITRIEDEIMNGRWEEAVKIENQLKYQWEKYKKIWPMLIDHADVDKVTTYLCELEVFITKKDEIMAASRLAILKLLMQNIPEKEYVILQNIF
ncbi:MAG TPA: DUF4363 family protein [Clostridiales bacterium]|nr:DUF4363 family protein [Clostridiales bacterium]